MGRIRRLPSPAMVVAVVALIAALGGSAYALKKNSVGTKALKKGAVTTKKIKNNAVVAAKIAPAAKLDLKGALAYAQIQDNGNTYVADRTSGFTTLTNPVTGRYCLGVNASIASKVFDGAGEPLRPAVGSVEFGNTGDPDSGDAVVAPRGGNSSCGANLLEVETFLGGALSNDVSFSLIVP